MLNAIEYAGVEEEVATRKARREIISEALPSPTVPANILRNSFVSHLQQSKNETSLPVVIICDYELEPQVNTSTLPDFNDAGL